VHIRLYRLTLAAAALLLTLAASAGVRPAAQAPAPNAWPA